MKALLLAVQDRLQSQVDYVRAADIYITPNLDIIPTAAGRPCIGIHDGPVTREELAGDVIASSMIVDLVIYVRILKNEASVVGDAATSAKGVLDIEADIDAALDSWLPASTYIRGGWKGGPTDGSEIVADGTQAASRKVLRYRFEKQEDR